MSLRQAVNKDENGLIAVDLNLSTINVQNRYMQSYIYIQF